MEKDYGPYVMIYDGQNFLKKVAGEHGHREPTSNQITEFQVDVARAAKNNSDIAVFVNRFPGIQLSEFARNSYNI